MKVAIGDLVFCHTIGNKLGWRLNQIGIVVAGSKKNTRFRAFLSSGGYDEFTTVDMENGNIEIIAKANGEEVDYSKNLEVIPNYMREMHEAYDKIDDDTLDRAFNQRALVNNRLDRANSRKRRLKLRNQ